MKLCFFYVKLKMALFKFKDEAYFLTLVHVVTK